MALITIINHYHLYHSLFLADEVFLAEAVFLALDFLTFGFFKAEAAFLAESLFFFNFLLSPKIGLASLTAAAIVVVLPNFLSLAFLLEIFFFGSNFFLVKMNYYE